MTMTNDVPVVTEVTQADRDHAIRYGKYRLFSGGTADRIAAGEYDDNDLVQAFASYRAALDNHSPDAGGVGEAVAYRYVHLDYMGRRVSRYGVHPTRYNGRDPIESHPLYAAPQPQSVGELWQHKKRGTVYEVIGEAELQCATHDPSEGDELVIYRGDDGKLWARMRDEFHDGRFEALRPEPRGEG